MYFLHNYIFKIFRFVFYFIHSRVKRLAALMKTAGGAQIENQSSQYICAVNAPPTTEYCLTNFVLPGTPRPPTVSEVQFSLSDQTPSTISSTSRTEWICRDENRSIFGDQIPWRYKAGQFSWAHLMCWSCCCCCTQTQRATLAFLQEFPSNKRFIWGCLKIT